MAIDPTGPASDVEGAGRTTDSGNERGLQAADQTAIRGVADLRGGEVQGAALRATGGNTSTDGFDRGVRTAQAMPVPLGPMMRFGPVARPAPGLEVPLRPSIPGTGPVQMAPREDKWTEKGFHKEKQDGGVTPGPEDERNPDLKGKERRDAVEDGREHGNRLRRENEIRQQRQQRQKEKGFWDRLREWFGPAPIGDQDLVA